MNFVFQSGLGPILHPSHGRPTSGSRATGTLTPGRPCPPPREGGWGSRPHPTAAMATKSAVGSPRPDPLPWLGHLLSRASGRWVLRAAAWGPAAPLDLAAACRIFLPGLPRHQGKHRQDVATYLVPRVASRPGGSSGGLQDTKRTVSGGTIGAAQGWGRARATLTWHSKEQHCGMGRGQRDMSGSVGTATPATRAQTAGGGTGNGDARVGDTGGGEGLTTCSTLFF